MLDFNNLGYCPSIKNLYTLELMDKESLDTRIYNNFLRILREYFEDKPGKMADQLKVKPSFISDIIHKRRKLSNNYIERISALAKIDSEEFFKGSHSKLVTTVSEERAVWIVREADKYGVTNQSLAVAETIVKEAKKQSADTPEAQHERLHKKLAIITESKRRKKKESA